MPNTQTSLRLGALFALGGRAEAGAPAAAPRTPFAMLLAALTAPGEPVQAAKAPGAGALASALRDLFKAADGRLEALSKAPETERAAGVQVVLSETAEAVQALLARFDTAPGVPMRGLLRALLAPVAEPGLPADPVAARAILAALVAQVSTALRPEAAPQAIGLEGELPGLAAVPAGNDPEGPAPGRSAILIALGAALDRLVPPAPDAVPVQTVAGTEAIAALSAAVQRIIGVAEAGLAVPDPAPAATVLTATVEAVAALLARFDSVTGAHVVAKLRRDLAAGGPAEPSAAGAGPAAALGDLAARLTAVLKAAPDVLAVPGVAVPVAVGPLASHPARLVAGPGDLVAPGSSLARGAVPAPEGVPGAMARGGEVQAATARRAMPLAAAGAASEGEAATAGVVPVAAPSRRAGPAIPPGAVPLAPEPEGAAPREAGVPRPGAVAVALPPGAVPAAGVGAAAPPGPRGRELLAALADFAGAPLRVTAAQGRATAGGPASGAAPATGAEAGPVTTPTALPRAAAAALAEPGAVPERSVPLPPAVPGEVRPPVIAAPPTAAPPAPDSAASLPDLARAVQAQIRGRSYAEGTTRIELSPQGLGDLEIELSPGEAGRLRVVLRADNPMVLAALRGDRDALLGALRDGGAQVSDAGLSFENFGARHGSGRQAPMQQGVPVAASAAVAELPDRDEAPRRLGPGRLDILT